MADWIREYKKGEANQKKLFSISDYGWNYRPDGFQVYIDTPHGTLYLDLSGENHDYNGVAYSCAREDVTVFAYHYETRKIWNVEISGASEKNDYVQAENPNLGDALREVFNFFRLDFSKGSK